MSGVFVIVLQSLAHADDIVHRIAEQEAEALDNRHTEPRQVEGGVTLASIGSAILR